MENATPFAYVDFYDVPRCMVLRHRGCVLLLQSAFNEQADEYEETYSVYRVDDAMEALARASNWEFLASADRELLGKVRVTDVEFDSTRRTIDAACLDSI